MDSNHRRRKPTDLQSAPFSHSGISPWSRRWDSDPQPADYKSAALPIELRRQTFNSFLNCTAFHGKGIIFYFILKVNTFFKNILFFLKCTVHKALLALLHSEEIFLAKNFVKSHCHTDGYIQRWSATVQWDCNYIITGFFNSFAKASVFATGNKYYF